ncbi:DUF732 domain-containing protein [Mycobacterium intracellulare]|jgi:hypothetical protein|uniref:DUF732 domain-containing protein n=4 Tax=Mycobacterium avium complex (MAC) TaxID=120793 RepID=A0ABN5ZQ73_9MYCO|nr:MULTISPECIES: DUF732 domain-containing protein [Mycobacterium]AFJ35785.1 hypothetical protein W7S_14100 [Mycobacterium sp. MOTT36Y]AGP64289.1 hypothetical protein OEM_27540 [Mycobacterium intracellulare subsp. yongonense 05-1390]ARR78418.1 Hydroxyproline-rich glycoprotein DZ-HRGP precursor [Mycobacterium intracellulare subsp. yongonense]KEF95800.1 hypothetical protein K883_04546 [Mycobacterium sp. TKK-01-0059]MCV7407413.1 DUF732 domain-containing protein [Mycobacterium marseillense]
MFAGITCHAGALVTATVVLAGTAIVGSGTVAADPNQDDQFLALLVEKKIPARRNVPSLIATAHKVCRKLDGGMPVDAVVDLMRNTAFNVDPPERQYPPERITRTLTRFITAAVEVYCPYNQQKIDSITAMASSAPGSNEPTHRVAASTHDTVNSASGPREPRFYMIDTPAARQEPMGTGVVRLTYVLDGATFVAGRYGNDRSDRGAPGTMLTSLTGAVPEGDSDLQNPPQIPPPPPPTAHNLIPPRPNAAPPPPKQPPPPQEPPPPPQQAEPPAAAPQPGGDAGDGGGGTGGGGSGGNGGGGPVQSAPAPHMPPGFVRLAP